MAVPYKDFSVTLFEFKKVDAKSRSHVERGSGLIKAQPGRLFVKSILFIIIVNDTAVLLL